MASTFSGAGGSGRPQPFVLGKGARMLRGMELAVKGAQGRSLLAWLPGRAVVFVACRCC